MESGVGVWSTPAWRATAAAWLDERLAVAGLARTGPAEQTRVRPWATLLRAPTTGGTVWLKAAAPATAFEVGLYELVDGVAPGYVLVPLAVDRERGWVVLPDGGPSLGERLSGPALVDVLADVLPRYGQLQRDLAPHAGDLLALGLADMRPEAMPARFADALDAVAAHAREHGTPAERERLAQVAGLGGTVARWSAQLAAAPGAPSADHNDLHPYNVLTGPDGRPLFFDWGDAVLAHPFASMLVALGFVQRLVLETTPDDPRLLRLRDAYLEVFADLAPHAELVATLELACRVGKIARALTWHRAVRALGPDDPEGAGFAGAPLATLTALMDAWYLTSW